MLKLTRPTTFAALLALMIAGIARADEPKGAAAKLVADKSPALVTIKFVLKIKFGGHEQENENEITGIMLDAKGLILCSSQQIGGISPVMQRAAAAQGMGDISATPTDVKVLIGDD